VKVDGVAPIGPAVQIVNSRGTSGYYRCVWTEAVLSCSAVVADTDLQCTNSGLWGDDTMEVWIDAAHDRSATLDSNDFYIATNATSVHETSLAGVSTPLTGFASAVTVVGTVNDAVADTGYVIEWSIPWTTLGVTPSAGLVLGFNVALDDRFLILDPLFGDVFSRYEQTSWTGFFNAPRGWGTLTLGAVAPIAAPDWTPFPGNYSTADQCRVTRCGITGASCACAADGTYFPCAVDADCGGVAICAAGFCTGQAGCAAGGMSACGQDHPSYGLMRPLALGTVTLTAP
jgi:hypothetical protein